MYTFDGAFIRKFGLKQAKMFNEDESLILHLQIEMKIHKRIWTLIPFILILVSCQRTGDENVIKGTTKDSTEYRLSKVISDSINTLTNRVETLDVEYTVCGCACPNWIRTIDKKKNDTTKSQLGLHFYIEPANKNLELPHHFDAFTQYLRVKGQFYEKEDYPKGTVETEEPMGKAKVFRYTELEVLNKANVKPTNHLQSLTLTYNAISCDCAQWSEAKFDKYPDKRVYYWLQPATIKLLNVNSLFDGENLPLKIKVTGRIINDNGFPRGKNLSKVGRDAAGIVFEYTSIEVLKDDYKENYD